MKINKQLLRQIIKEELQNVLEQDELGGDTLAGKTLAPGDPGYEDLQGNNPSRDTLAGKTIAQDTLAGKTTGFDEPQQDVQQMATKYAKVKQILAKLVKEL